MLEGPLPLDRFRASVPAGDAQAAPPQSVETTAGAYLVHWAVPVGQDPFVAGALWALSWSLTTVFGETVGGFLAAATLDNVERWNGTRWAPYPAS